MLGALLVYGETITRALSRPIFVGKPSYLALHLGVIKHVRHLKE